MSQPDVEFVTVDVAGGRYTYARHPNDEPCVFEDHQCSCGRLEIGIIGEEAK